MHTGKRERWLRFVNVNLGTNEQSRLARDVSLKKIANEIDAALKRKERLQRKPRNNARRHVRLVDLRFSSDMKYVAFLFRLIDRTAIDVTYEDFDNGELESHPKRVTQGNRATAHLVVRLKPLLKASRKCYPAILEETSGLAAGRVEQVLDSLSRAYGRGSYKDSSGKESQYTCTIEVKPKVVGSIKDELRKGVLKGFTLVHSFSPVQTNDEDVYIEDKRKKLDISVVGTNLKNRLDDVWKMVRNKAKSDDYELVKANYENSDGRMTSVDMESRRADALEELVTKTKKVDLDRDENYDQLTVSWTVVAKMIKALEEP